MKNIFLTRLLLLFSLLFSLSIFAAPVDEIKARATAAGWLTETQLRPLGAKLNGNIASIDPYFDADGDIIYYVISLKPEGFIVVSADDQIEPVISFSQSGKYDPNAQNPLYALLNKDMKKRNAFVKKDLPLIAKGLKGPGKVGKEKLLAHVENTKGKWDKLSAKQPIIMKSSQGNVLTGTGSIGDVRVASFVDSRWDQDTVAGSNCYNYYTPNNYVCGCVATAMAQLMRYHQYPTAGIGIHSNTIEVSDVPEPAQTRGGNGTGGAYAWNLMPLVPNASITLSERQMIGSLCYDAGVAVGMMYDTTANGGSGAYMDDVPPAMKNVFDYTNAICYSNSGGADANVYNMVNTNLDARLPVLFGIRDATGGHAIVCDGYGFNSSTPYHHLNMGWSGSYDMWYNLPTVDTFVTFDTLDSVVYNIYPSGTGEIVSGRVLDEDGVTPLSGATVRAGAITATTDAEGIYALVHVPAGTYTIKASKLTYGMVAVSKTVTTSFSIGNTGNIWGVNFTLPRTTVPAVISTSVDAITATSASVTGEVVDDISIPQPTERGFCYGTSADPVVTGNKVVVNGQIGVYSGTISNLTPGLTYYVRAYATNTSGTGYGENLSFKSATEIFPVNAQLPAGWFTPGTSTGTWIVDTDQVHEGNYCLSSGTTDADSNNQISYTADFQAGTVSFYYKVSSEDTYDYLRFYIDDLFTPVDEWTGEDGWTQVSFPISAGSHTLMWSYEKDAYTIEGSDKAWIDSVSLPPLAGSGTLAFTSAAYSAGEADGTATITVNRTGGGNGAVSVLYSTGGGIATKGADYTATTGTLTWANGDTADKTIPVPIMDDSLIEGDETLNITLSSPAGAALGGQSSAVLTIIDDDKADIVTADINNNLTDTISIDENYYTTFKVKLSIQPESNIDITVANTAGSTDVTVRAGYQNLHFTPSTWNVWQAVKLDAAHDADSINDTATISFTSARANTKNLDVTVIDDEPILTITNDGNGTTNPSAPIVTVKDGLVSISATPNANYDFLQWTVVSGSATITKPYSASTTVRVASGATIKANFSNHASYLTMAAFGDGTTSPAANSITAMESGTVVPITATTQNGSTFVGWTGGQNAVFNNASSASTNVTVNGDATVTANFVTGGGYTLTQNGQDNSGISGGLHSQTVFAITVPGNSLLKVTTSGGTGDCDLYLKYGSPPTLTPPDYDRKSTSSGNDESIEVNCPTAGIWYVMLYGYEIYSGVSLIVSYSDVPPKPTWVSSTKGTYGDKISLKWTKVTGATGYEIYRSTVDNIDFAKKLNSSAIAGTASTYDDAPPGAGVNNIYVYYNYYYWIRALNANGAGEFSDSINGYTCAAANPPLVNGAAKTAISGTADSVRTFKLASVPAGQTLLEIRISGTVSDCDIDVVQPNGTVIRRSVSGTSNELVQLTNPVAGDWLINLHGITDYSKLSLTAKYSITAPAAPAGMAASDGLFENKIVVTWKAVPGATSYDVYRYATKVIPLVTDSPIATVADNTYEDLPAAAGPYYYFARAKNLAGTSKFSSGDSGYILSKAPTVPAAPMASDGTYFDKIRVSWATVKGATSYLVYRTEDTIAPNPVADLIDETNALFIDDFGDDIVPQVEDLVKKYYYWIAAKNATGTSAISKFNDGFLSKKGPATLTATNGTYLNKITVTWSAVPGATAYDVYRYDDKGLSVHKFMAGNAVTATFCDDTVIQDMPFYYYVKAKYGVYDSASSSTAMGMALASGMATLVPNLLTDNVPINSIADDIGHSQYYSIDVPIGTTRLVATLNGTGTSKTNDCDLFAKFANYPTVKSFGAKGVESILNNTETLTVSNPAAGTWYFLLYGTTTYSGFKLTVSYYTVTDIVLTQVPANDLTVPYTAVFKGKVVDAEGIGIPNIVVQVRNPITSLTRTLTKTDTKGFFSHSALVNSEGEHTFDFFFSTIPDTAKGTASHTVGTKKGCLETDNFFDFSAYLPASPVAVPLQLDVTGLQTFLDIRNGWIEGTVNPGDTYEKLWINSTIVKAGSDAKLFQKLDEGLYLFFYGVEGAGVGNDMTTTSALSAVPFVVHVSSGQRNAVLDNLLANGIIDDVQKADILAGKIGIVAVGVLNSNTEGSDDNFNISLLAREQLEILAKIAAGTQDAVADGGKYTDALTRKSTITLDISGRVINVLSTAFVK